MRVIHPEVPWKAVAGMRDIAAHKYQTLRMEDVYNTVKQDFSVLKVQLKKIWMRRNKGYMEHKKAFCYIRFEMYR